MKKLNLKKNGNFSVVSHKYVLYGRKHGDTAYVHMEDAHGTTYMVDGVEWRYILRLVRDKISWEVFVSVVSYYWCSKQEEYYNM